MQRDAEREMQSEMQSEMQREMQRDAERGRVRCRERCRNMQSEMQSEMRRDAERCRVRCRVTHATHPTHLHPTATGLDGLPAWFLRLGAPAFSRPIASLFNLSLATSTVPQQWKQASIRPIPKVTTPKHTQTSDPYPSLQS